MKKLEYYLTPQQIQHIRQNFNLEIIDLIPPGPNQEQPKLFIAKQGNKEVFVKNITGVVNSNREVEIMMKFKGVANIIQIIDKVQDANYELIIMERAQCDLNRYINQCKIISDKNLIQITSNILQGLESMHQQKDEYWHRDLKPANIFIFLNNDLSELQKTKREQKLFSGEQKVYAKIGDLGQAKQVIQRKNQHTEGIGTQPFKSPEMQNQQCKYTNKIDIWSMGLTLFELFTKTSYTKFYQENPSLCKTQEGCRSIRIYLQSVIDSKKYSNKLKKIIKDIVHQCIEFDPVNRYLSKDILLNFRKARNELNNGSSDTHISQGLQIGEGNQINQVNLSEMHRNALKTIQNYKQNHENFLKTLEMALKKVNYFLKLIEIKEKEQQLKTNKKDIIMIHAIKKNIEWEIYQYKKVIQKYKQNIQLEENLIKNIKSNKKQIEIKQRRIQLQNNISKANNILNRIRKDAMKKIDICFMIDGTGSMRPTIQQVKLRILQVIKVLINSNSFIKLRFSFVIYRDFDLKDRSIQILPFVDSASSSFLADIEKFLNKINATGGDDQAQDINGALQRVMELDWQSYSKAIFHYTDAPCHQKKYNGLQSSDSYLNKIPQSDIQYSKIFKEFKTVGIHYFILQVEKCDAVRYMYDAFKKQYDDEKPYRSRTNTLGTINFFNYKQIKGTDFIQTIQRMGTQINLITTSSAKVKRRVPKSEAEYLSQKPFDNEDERKEFLG